MSLNNQHSNFTTNSNCNCKCGKPSVQRRVAKEGPNKGRSFLTCATSSCNFFQWLGPPQTSGMNVATDGEASAGAIAIKAASRTNDAVGPTPLLLLYTDGSCLGNQNVVDKACPAGWAVVVVRPAGAAIEPRFSVATDLTVEHVPLSALHGSVGEHHYIGVKRSAEAVPEATASYSATEEVIEELYGTVELSQAGRGYMGATVGNTVWPMFLLS